MRVDAHQHFWRYDPHRHDWMTEAMGTLKQDWLPEQLWPELQARDVAATIAVQSCGDEGETAFLLDVAAQHGWVRGVVGWLDLRASDLSDRLAYWRAQGPLVGIRHQLQDEPQYFDDPRFHQGVERLQHASMVYEVLVTADQISQAVAFCQRHDQAPLVLDHLGKPPVTAGAEGWVRWSQQLAAIAALPHVMVKLSGLATEAGPDPWVSQLDPFVDAALTHIGPERLLWGSDWPVCQLRASYDEVLTASEAWLAPLNAAEQAAILGGNAIQLYGL